MAIFVSRLILLAGNPVAVGDRARFLPGNLRQNPPSLREPNLDTPPRPATPGKLAIGTRHSPSLEFPSVNHNEYPTTFMETHFPNIDEDFNYARERLMADLGTLAHDAEALLAATSGDVSEKAVEARGRLTAALEKARSTYKEIQTKGIESAKAAAKKADATIRAHPYESIGIAFGIGVLLGALLRRK